MMHAGRKEGHCAPLFYFAAAVALSAGACSAQTVDVAELEACAALDAAAAKLACYEALTATPSQVPAAAAAPEPAAPPAGDTPFAAPTVAAPKPMATMDAAIPAATATVTARPAPADAAASAADPEPAAAPVDVDPPEARATVAPTHVPVVSGAERPGRSRSSDGEANGPVTATVTRVTRDHRDRLEFHLADGQVWRQTEPRRFPYPKGRDFDVVITQGMMGDYRLRVDGAGPMVRIRQVE